MDLNDLQSLIPGAIKDVGTGIATGNWRREERGMRPRNGGESEARVLALSIRSAFHTRDYLGIALVGGDPEYHRQHGAN